MRISDYSDLINKYVTVTQTQRHLLRKSVAKLLSGLEVHSEIYQALDERHKNIISC